MSFFAFNRSWGKGNYTGYFNIFIKLKEISVKVWWLFMGTIRNIPFKIELITWSYLKSAYFRDLSKLNHGNSKLYSHKNVRMKHQTSALSFHPLNLMLLELRYRVLFFHIHRVYRNLYQCFVTYLALFHLALISFIVDLLVSKQQ